MAASSAYATDASARREAAQNSLKRYRRRAMKRCIAQWLFIAALVAIGYAAGTLTKSCSAAEAASAGSPQAVDTTSFVTPAPEPTRVVDPPPPSVAKAGEIPPPSPEKWCAAFIREVGGARAKAHAVQTAEAVAACAPLLGPWMDEREATCFIMAVIWKESTFDPCATGTSRDRGLMQLVEGYHAWRWKGKDWREPSVNVRAGTGLLVEKMRKYHGAVETVLTSYNGCWDNPKSYVPFVMHNYKALLKSWDAAGVASAGSTSSPQADSGQAEAPMDRL